MDDAGAATTLRQLVAPVRRRLALACLLWAFGSAAGVVPLVAVAEAARELAAPGPVDDARVRGLASLALAALGVRGLCQFVAGSITHFADNDLQLALRRRLAERLRRVPLGWFSERSSGLVKKAVGDDVATMHHVVAHALLDMTAAIVVPVVSVGWLVWLDWRLALVALVPVLVGGGLYAAQMAGAQRHMPAYGEALGRVNSAAVELVRGIAVVKVFGRSRRAHERFVAAADGFVAFFWDMVRGMVRLSSANEVLTSPVAAMVLILGAGTLFVGQGWSDPSDVAAATVLGVGLTSPILALGHAVHSLQQASAAAGRVGDVLATPVLPEPAPEPAGAAGAAGAPAPGRRHPTVTYEGVRFGYRGSDVLHGVDLTLAPGTVTALVGPSGAGKTTVARLLPRFWDVTGGAVRIDGVDVRAIPTDRLLATVGVVFQDVRLLAVSVRDNIRLADPAAPDAAVEAAARAAQVHDRIQRLPRGYDSVIGEDAHLSGGEAQRVSIARALLADAPVLVLDEATAFADPESEAAIQDALSTLAAGRTVLVVAHRLATVTNADQIVVLDGGRVAEAGTHAELLARRGRYHRMWAAQSAEDRALVPTGAPATTRPTDGGAS